MEEAYNDEKLDELFEGNSSPRVEDEVAPQVSKPEPFKFTARGKEIVADDPEKTKQWLSMGYDYAQNVEQLKKQQAEFNQKLDEYNQKYSLYEKIDQHAASNPDWWNYVQSNYQNASKMPAQRTAPTQEGEQLDPKIMAFKEEVNKELEDLRKFKNEILAERTASKLEQEDKAYLDEVHSVRERHKDLDWTSLDTNGYSLEGRVLEHARKNGINSFDIAFKHMMHDELLNRAQLSAQEKAKKELQRNSKLGILGETTDPLKRVLEGSGNGKKTWDQVERDILSELGLAN